MSTARMPERFIQAVDQRVSDMKVGEEAWVNSTDVYVDGETGETFVGNKAKLRPSNYLFNVKIRREADGLRLAFLDPPDKKLPRFTFAPLTKLDRREGVTRVASIELKDRPESLQFD